MRKARQPYSTTTPTNRSQLRPLKPSAASLSSSAASACRRHIGAAAASSRRQSETCSQVPFRRRNNMEPVPLIEVESSNVRAIGYDADTKRLVVQFKKSGIYQYDNVPEALYHSFSAAQSKGQFVWRHLRGRYPYTRID